MLEIKNLNSMMFTSKILGLTLNDLTMKQGENAALEDRLEKIESHLSIIARTRSDQLRFRKRIWIIAGFEVLSLLRVFG